MLSLPQIDVAASDVAAATLRPGALVRAQTRLYHGLARDSASSKITGQHALERGGRPQRRLQADREDRFAVIAFATDEELAADGGP